MAHLQQVLSAQEFARWIVWMDAEQVGPDWDALRHAQIMAALHNGAVKRAGGGLFRARDFMRNPWAPQAEEPDPTADLIGRLDAAWPE